MAGIRYTLLLFPGNCKEFAKSFVILQREFTMINNMNIEARYPDYKTGIARSLSDQKSREIIDKTKQMQQWIIQESLPETKPSSSSETTSE